jgi:type IV pilus assembly protein PilB
VLDEEIKRAILNGVSAIDLKKLAIARGMHTLRQSAVVKLAKGLVPLSEVLKETSSDTE